MDEFVVIFKGIVRALLFPPGPLIVLCFVLACRWLVSGSKRRRTGAGFTMLLLAVVLYVTHLPWLATKSSVWVEAQVSPLKVDQSNRYQLGSAQAIVILAGGLRSEAKESAHLGPEASVQPNWRTLERLQFGSRIARQSSLPILVSGGVPLWRSGASEGQAMAFVLEHDFGLKVHWIEAQSLDTESNARLSAEILKQAGVSSVVLVTHASHMPRSVAAFERYGLQVVPAPAAFSSNPPTRFTSFLPSSWAAARLHDNIYEIVGQAWYRLAAWVAD